MMPDRADPPANGTPAEARDRLTRAGAAALLGAIGRSPVGNACLRALGWAARSRLLPQTSAMAVAGRVAARKREPALVFGRALGASSRVHLRVDLRLSGCLELLLAPRPGASDPGTLALLIELARGAALALDVGANVGVYTYLLAATLPDLRIVTLEPVSALAALITDNVRRNDWSSRVVVHQEAVGATSTTSTLYVLQRADTEHTFAVDRLAGRDHESVPVRVVTIDELLAHSGVPLDRVVLKIDVEGYERPTLDGMQQTLQARGPRPDVIMEFLGHAIQEGIIERVIASGMHVYYIGPSGITRLARTSDLAPVHTLGFWNFLLTPRPPEEVSGIWDRAAVPSARGQRRAVESS